MVMFKNRFRSLISRSLIKRSLLVMICCSSYLVMFMGEAKSVGMKWDSSGSLQPHETCTYTKFIEIQPTGFIRVTFRIYNSSSCVPFAVRNVVTSPQNILRGSGGFVKGTNEVKKGTSFWLDVAPEAKSIQILAPARSGVLVNITFNLEYVISKLAEAATSTNWQQSFQRSETKLAEIAKTDKSPPKIILQSPDVTPQQQVFRVDTYQTFVRGKVSDNAGVSVVLVNGAKAGVKADGSFAKKVKLAFGSNQMKVQAEDIHGNIAERTFTIIREEFIPDEVIADVDIPIKTRMNNPDGIGVVIGVESYQYVSDATYAYNDAEVFREYLADTLGYKKSKIKIATNSKATQAELNKLLGPNGWIARNVKAGKSDVVVYFSGHGIPDAKTKKTGLLPFDVDPNYSIGITLKDLYKTLGNLNARSVTVFLDTCFSGQGREKQTLLADTRGIQIVPKERDVPSNVTVLSAATAGQVSGPIKAKEHGLFTYYVLKGMGGDADGNKDKKLTMSELGQYVHSKVKEDAAITGREQTPELQGDAERVLVRW
jgi:hypothetical protein